MGFIGCPCALGSPFISTTRTFVPSRPPVMSSFFGLVRAHVHIGPHLSFTPPLEKACVCVPLVVIGILLNCFYSAGGSWTHGWHEPTKTHPCRRDTRPDQSGVRFSFLSEWHEAKPRTSLGRQVRPSSPCRFVVDLRLWPPFLLKTPRPRWSLLELLGNGTLGRRVAPLSVPYAYP